MNTQPAPTTESYLPTPTFQYTPGQREIDFAQVVASGADIVYALLIASLVSSEEYNSTPRSRLYSMAARLLDTPAVQERLDYYTQLHKASMSVSTDRIRQELACVAFTDPANYADPQTGTPYTNLHDVPRYARAAVKEFKLDDKGQITYKMHDKLKAIQMIGDLQGAFDEAHRAKATQVSVTLGDGRGQLPSPSTPCQSQTAPQPQPQPQPTIDITPEPVNDTINHDALPDCLL